MDNTTANHCFCSIFGPAFADTVRSQTAIFAKRSINISKY